MRYAVVEKAGNNYSAYAPNLSGRLTTGNTIEGAEQEIRKAIKFQLLAARIWPACSCASQCGGVSRNCPMNADLI